MASTLRQYRAAAGLIRRGDEVLLVRQRGPGDLEAGWALPGGLVEAGETIEQALVREVREETGLEVDDIGPLLYTAQFDNPLPQRLHQNTGPGDGYQATTFVFEVPGCRGEIACADPDDLVSEARFFPLGEAISLIEQITFRVMREPIVAHLRGEVAPGAIWIYRRRAPDDDVLVARTAGTDTRASQTCLLGELDDAVREM